MDSMVSSQSCEPEMITEIAKTYLQAVSCIEEKKVPNLAYLQTEVSYFIFQKASSIKIYVIRADLHRSDTKLISLFFIRSFVC